MTQAIAKIEETTAAAESRDLSHVQSGPPDVNPMAVFERAEEIVALMARRCAGPAFISTIQGRKYPQVTWWTSVGAALGLTTVEVANERLARPGGEIVYQATVEIRHGDRLVGRGSAICSSRERRWSRAEEYAIRSMAATRATGKAYRLSCSWIATLAGLEATPDEEATGAIGAASGDAAEWPENLEELFGLACERRPELRTQSLEHFWTVTVRSWATKAGRAADEQFVAELIDRTRNAIDTTAEEAA